ncbi:MAG: long-chain fatty acid--CoA ligase [Candidatus Goldiibacteriota bacterium]|jgi:long-chain acyl-CoA synthetase
MSLLQVIKNSALAFPDKIFIVCEKEKRTFSGFYKRVKKLGSGLDSLGIKKGDKVAVLLHNCAEYVEIYFAAISRGAVIVPVNTFLKTEEVAFILNDCGVKAIFTSSDFSAIAGSIDRQAAPSLESIVSIDSIKGLDYVKYSGLFGAELEPVDAGSDDIAAILYTSGTTGHPKGAMLSHKNLISDVENSIGIIDITHRDVFMCFLPMFHSFSFMANVMVPLYCGCRLVILKSIQPFTKVIKNMLLQRVSVFVAIPQVFILMAEKHIPFFVLLFNSIRICISGGASIPVESIKKFEVKFRKPLVEGYGLSEASPICALNPLNGRRVPGSIGPAINNVAIVIRDDGGKEMPDGSTGELTVKGDNVMKGYYNNPEATAEALKDGWLYTGDIGKKDSDGYVYILDRKKDMIIVNGMNVYPREVEEILYKNPAVAEACVVGEKDELHGEIPVAVLVLKEGFSADEHAFRKFCREHIANYKVPHRIEFWKELPKNSTGKVLKKDIRDMIEERKQRA